MELIGIFDRRGVHTPEYTSRGALSGVPLLLDLGLGELLLSVGQRFLFGLTVDGAESLGDLGDL
jgi:hypothetical protein